MKQIVDACFLESSCYLYYRTNVGSLIAGSSASLKPSLYIWMVLVHVLPKPILKDFKHNLPSTWNECNCMVVRTFFGIILLGTGMEIDLFQSCGHCWVSQICWHIDCSSLLASFFRILNSSAGIPSPTLALLVVMFPKAHFPSYSRMSGSRKATTPLWLSRSLKPFLYNSLVYSFHLFLISSTSVWSLMFPSFITPKLAWNVPLVSPVFLKRSLVFPILLLSSISLYYSFQKPFSFFSCYSLELCIQLGISFLFFFAFCLSSFPSYL